MVPQGPTLAGRQAGRSTPVSPAALYTLEAVVLALVVTTATTALLHTERPHR